MSQNPKFRLAIIGGGLGGLTLAIAISKGSQDIDVDLYEAAPSLSDLGAGIGMFLRPFKVMQALGLEDELRTLVDIPPVNQETLGIEVRKANQREGIKVKDIYMPLGNLPMGHGEFQKLLERNVPSSVKIHFDKRLISYSEPESVKEPIKFQFTDGSTGSCDILIACDGIHSPIRHQMFKEAAAKETDREKAKELIDTIEPIWTGTVAYRDVLKKELLDERIPGHRTHSIPTSYVGIDKHVIVFDMTHGKYTNVVAFCTEPEKEGTEFVGNLVESRSQEELLSQYEGWEPELVDILKCIDKPTRWVIKCLKAVPIYTHGRVVLTGDAAHATTPHQISGAGQAIEDAYILGAILCSPLTTLGNITQALKVYEDIRLPKANGVVRRSRRNGRLYELEEPEFADLRSDVLPQNWEDRLTSLGDAIVENWEWAWTTDIDLDKQRALQLLSDRLG